MTTRPRMISFHVRLTPQSPYFPAPWRPVDVISISPACNCFKNNFSEEVLSLCLKSYPQVRLIDSFYVYNKKTDMVFSNVAAFTYGQSGAGADGEPPLDALINFRYINFKRQLNEFCHLIKSRRRDQPDEARQPTWTLHARC
ncbi:MAG: hypothetical protein JWR03_1695 [Cohnella sp.]|nr:hypothetical protein [Cohnella sp.]